MPAVDFVFPPPACPAVPVAGNTRHYPVGRVFCVGRNYAAHAREMGFAPDREQPFYFTKAPAAVVASGDTVDYPPGTNDFHHEVELVVAIGAPVFEITAATALDSVFGYACGLDMTRRDLQRAARSKRYPWDISKDVEAGAVVGPIRPVTDCGHPRSARIRLAVNGDTRQDSNITAMIWPVADIVAHLSHFYHLVPGDLIFTGTPEGVGPVEAGDTLSGSIDGVGDVELHIAAA
ncbi:MAG: fumarylacetoacetate hydrolase family protein [Gammaproteobacteria bacterium]|nr:fumarylacetoacetate hydrolase family protein [Gammaproteobacteria bacterium]NNM01802.1 fumarylacetoacetate hydrolase family protein [Gammaproteobacteria bacterium]